MIDRSTHPGELDRLVAPGHPLDEDAGARIPRPPAMDLRGTDDGDRKAAVQRRSLHRHFRWRVAVTGEGVDLVARGRQRRSVLAERHGEPWRLIAIDVPASGILVHRPRRHHHGVADGTHRRQQGAHIGRPERHNIDEQVSARTDDPLDRGGIAPLDRMEPDARVGQGGRHRRRIPPGHLDRPAPPGQGDSSGAADGAGSSSTTARFGAPPSPLPRLTASAGASR